MTCSCSCHKRKYEVVLYGQYGNEIYDIISSEQPYNKLCLNYVFTVSGITYNEYSRLFIVKRQQGSGRIESIGTVDMGMDKKVRDIDTVTILVDLENPI